MRGVLLLAPGLLLLAGCSNEAPPPEPESTDIPDELNGGTPLVVGEAGIGTPMEDRVATLGLLNKRNNLTQDVELKPGETRRLGDVILRLSACERTVPWESPPEMGAFVQVSVLERPDADTEEEWHQVFSGWLFKNSPSLNVVEHPIYDVWVKDCAMSFPGEDKELAPGRSAPSAPRAPVADPAPAEPAPAVAAPAETTSE